MAHKFYISRGLFEFEVHVDGKVEVKPLPNKDVSVESHKVLAEAYQSFCKNYLIKNRNEDLFAGAVEFFETKGFKIKVEE